MKTVEDLEEADSVDMGSGYLMCLVEIYQQDCEASSSKRIFGLVVTKYLLRLFQYSSLT